MKKSGIQSGQHNIFFLEGDVYRAQKSGFGKSATYKVAEGNINALWMTLAG